MAEADRTGVAPAADADADELETLRRERDEAVATCRELEHELGALRGRVKRLELITWRRVQRRQRWLGRARRVLGTAGRVVPSQR